MPRFLRLQPVLMATPDTLASLTEPTTLADVALVDACAHIPAIQLLSIVSRVKQIVINRASQYGDVRRPETADATYCQVEVKSVRCAVPQLGGIP